MPDNVTICECFARDGLQHEKAFVPTAAKLALLESFVAAGFSRIEATSYSHPRQVPALRDASDVLAGVVRHPGVSYKATCPNPRAVQRAVDDHRAGRGADELSFLVSATESHSRRNLHASRSEQWGKVEEMFRLAGERFRIVGVISVAFGCPFEGEVDPGRVADDVGRFVALGAELVTLGDSTGMATPLTVRRVFRRLADERQGSRLVAHCHDNRGLGLVNCLAALESGCEDFDSAFGGVGGHPAEIEYGEGVTGNVATEDLVNLLEGAGVATNLDLERTLAASRLCEQTLGRRLDSKVARAGFALPHARAAERV